MNRSTVFLGISAATLALARTADAPLPPAGDLSLLVVPTEPVVDARPTWNGFLMIFQLGGPPENLSPYQLTEWREEFDAYTRSLIRDLPQTDNQTFTSDSVRSLYRYFSRSDGQIPGTEPHAEQWREAVNVGARDEIQELYASIYRASAIREIHRSAWEIERIRQDDEGVKPSRRDYRAELHLMRDAKE